MFIQAVIWRLSQLMRVPLQWLVLALTAAVQPVSESVELLDETDAFVSELQFVGFEIDPDRSAETSSIAAEGRALLFGGKAFRNGLPEDTFRVLTTLVPDKEPHDAFRHEGVLPSPPTREPELGGPAIPLGDSTNRRDGTTLMTKNCFSCHAGINAGMAVAGLGNAHTDQVQALLKFEKLVRAEPVLKVFTEARIRAGLASPGERDELANIFYQIDEMLVPTHQHARARGDNMGPYGVWMYLARMEDPATQGLRLLPRGETSKYTKLFAAESLPTVDPNPWWHRKYKTTSYRYGETAQQRSAHFAVNFTNPHEEVNETHEDHVAVIDTILKFADQTQAPAYPQPLDATLEAEGAALYHGNRPLQSGRTLACASCHGTYRKVGSWGVVGHYEVDYREQGVQDVGTDTRYNDFLRRMKPLADRTYELAEHPSFTGKEALLPTAVVPAVPGYVAPPLVGAWISAPYFHNGSVATIEQVLDSSQRPQAWRRSLDPSAYDHQGLGLAHEEVDMTLEAYEEVFRRVGHSSGEAGTAFRSIYHTAEFGRSNVGHQHGDDMTDEERRAVIEFIKSLGGPEMGPVSQRTQ